MQMPYIRIVSELSENPGIQALPKRPAAQQQEP